MSLVAVAILLGYPAMLQAAARQQTIRTQASRDASRIVRELPHLLPEYDVIIAGAGTGGTMAAVQAARLGASVLLTEETDWIGGQMTAAAVSSMDEGPPGSRYGSGRQGLRDRGLYGEFIRHVTEYYEKLGISTDTCAISENHLALEPHVGQAILYRMLADESLTAPVHLALCSTVTRVMLRDRQVAGVALEQESTAGLTRRSVRCKMLIDATEFGSVIPLTGARYRVGNVIRGGPGTSVPSPGKDAANPPIQNFTWTAVIRRYPSPPPRELMLAVPPPGYDRRGFAAILNNPLPRKTNKPWSWQRFIGYRGMPDSTNPDTSIRNPWAAVTRTHVNFDANDVSVTAQDIEDPARWQRKQADLKLQTLRVLYYIQNDMNQPVTTWTVATDEGYDTPFNRRQNERLAAAFPEIAPYLPVLRHFPPKVYARESLRIVGAFTLRARDIDRRSGPKLFAHSVAVGDYPTDLHGALRPQDIESDLDTPDDFNAIGFTPNRMGAFTIPFEVFIPEAPDGFLPAEKNLSQSRIVSGATRLQPITMLTGQAAGAIAALSVSCNLPPRHLRPAVVQSALLDAGDILCAMRGDQHRFPGVEPGTPLWKTVQLALLYGILKPGEGAGSPQGLAACSQFPQPLRIATDSLTRDWLATLLSRQFPKFEADTALLASFADVTTDSPHLAAIQTMVTKGVMQASASAEGLCFRPDAQVCRADLAQCLVQILGLTQNSGAATCSRFADVPAAHPACEAIHALAAARVAPRFWRLKQPMFQPDQPLVIADYVRLFEEMLLEQPPDARQTGRFDMIE